MLKTRYNQEIESEKKISTYLKDGKISSLENTCDILWYKYQVFLVQKIHENDFSLVRKNANIAGVLDLYRMEQFNSRILDYGLTHILISLLSDNEKSIQQYAKSSYQKGRNAELSMDEMVSNGETAIWCNTIQFFIQNNVQVVERNLKIIETKTLPKLPKNQLELKIDFEFYKALLLKDKLGCEELLNELITPKIHKKRNDNPVLNQYISMPALGYAKLAWRLGIEVEVDSPLVPKELLPIKPLENYEIPYDFLIDHSR